MDGEAQDADVREAEAVSDRVVERLDQAAARTEGIDRWIGVVDHIGVRPIGVDGEAAVGAAQHEAAGPVSGSSRARSLGGTGADRRDLAVESRGVVTIDVGVVGQDVAGGIGACRAVGHATGLHGRAGVVVGERGVVGAEDADVENGRVTETTGVIQHGVVERLDDDVAEIQAIDEAVGVVDHVGVIAIGLDREGAIQPHQQESAAGDGCAGQA